jgi:hypothetical protein
LPKARILKERKKSETEDKVRRREGVLGMKMGEQRREGRRITATLFQTFSAFLCETYWKWVFTRI